MTDSLSFTIHTLPRRALSTNGSKRDRHEVSSAKRTTAASPSNGFDRECSCDGLLKGRSARSRIEGEEGRGTAFLSPAGF